MHRSFKGINLSYVGISFCLALYFVVIVNLPFYSALSDVLSKLTRTRDKNRQELKAGSAIRSFD